MLKLRLLISLIILGIIGGFGYSFINRYKPESPSQPSITQTFQQQEFYPSKKQSFGIDAATDCPTPLFTVLPMRLEDFTAFRPLGFVTFPGHIFGAKHSNFVINQPGENKKGLEVRFPSDATVTQITSTSAAQGSSYQIVFYPCQQFKSYFFHLGTISEALQNAFEKGEPICKDFHFGLGQDIKKCELKTNVKVKVGDLVGTNDGTSGVDWGGVDYRLSHSFANPQRYDFDYLHYVSPIPYLIPELKTAMIDRLRSYDGTVRRIVDPLWGTIAQDLLGTAQGNWFLADKTIINTQDFSIFLALLHDYIDPEEPIIVMGSSVAGLKFGIYSFVPQISGIINRDFQYVKPDGQIYCYENFKRGTTVGKIHLSQVSGSILMFMPDDKTLRVAYQTDTCSTIPDKMPTSATTFLR